MIILGLVIAVLVLRPPRLVLPIRPRRREVDVLLVARLVALAVSAGLPLGRALGDAGARVPEHVRPVIDDVLTRARRTGLARALAETVGPLGDLAGRLAQAQVTGAPIGPALDAYIGAAHDARRARAGEEARTIGVKLVVPLTLLLLPGFVALVVAPFLLEQASGLLGGSVP